MLSKRESPPCLIARYYMFSTESCKSQKVGPWPKNCRV
jgi:hypothetical protein